MHMQIPTLGHLPQERQQQRRLMPHRLKPLCRPLLGALPPAEVAKRENQHQLRYRRPKAQLSHETTPPNSKIRIVEDFLRRPCRRCLLEGSKKSVLGFQRLTFSLAVPLTRHAAPSSKQSSREELRRERKQIARSRDASATAEPPCIQLSVYSI